MMVLLALIGLADRTNWDNYRALDKQGLWKNLAWYVLLAGGNGSETVQWTATAKSTVQKYASQLMCNWEVKNTGKGDTGLLMALTEFKLCASNTYGQHSTRWHMPPCEQSFCFSSNCLANVIWVFSFQITSTTPSSAFPENDDSHLPHQLRWSVEVWLRFPQTLSFFFFP